MVKVKIDLAKATDIYNALKLATPTPGHPETAAQHENAIRYMSDAIDEAIQSLGFAAYAESKSELDRLAAPTRY